MDVEELVEKANNADHTAQAQLSLMYFQGDGVNKDETEARKWLRKASKDMTALDEVLTLDALADNPLALYLVSDTWHYKNDQKRNEFCLAAAKLGNPSAQHAYGFGLMQDISESGQDTQRYREAEYWLLESLKNEYTSAHKALYKLYSEAQYGELTNFEKAFYHLSFEAENGGSEATLTLGNFYYKGLGTQQDPVQAAKWFFISGCTNTAYAREELIAARAAMTDKQYKQARTAAIEWIQTNAATANAFHYKRGLLDPLIDKPLDISIQEPQKEEYQWTMPLADIEFLQQWHRYCEGDTTIDSDEFASLLYEDPKRSDEILQDMFRYYDCKDELIKRYRAVCDCKFSRTKIEAVYEDIEAAAKADLLLKLQLCESYCRESETDNDYLTGITPKRINNAKTTFTNDRKAYRKLTRDFSLPSLRLLEVLNDAMNSHIDIDTITGYHGLYTALYSLTLDFTQVFYVLQPFSKTDMDFEPYLNIKRAGADYQLTDDRILVYIDKRRKVVEAVEANN